MSNNIKCFFTEHKGVRRLSKLILFILGVFATWQVFTNMADVTNGVAVCYTALLGVLGASVWKYMDTSK